VVTEYTVPSPVADAGDMVYSARDDRYWFVEPGEGSLGVFNYHTHAFSALAVPYAGSKPFGITVGPDGNIWFTDQGTNSIGTLNPTATQPSIIEYKVAEASTLAEIASGSDGRVWFTDEGYGCIDAMTTSGSVTYYGNCKGGSPALYKPFSITAGPDNNLWFTDLGQPKIGSITTTGTISLYSLDPKVSSPQSYASWITTGSDGYLWYAQPGYLTTGSQSTTLVSSYVIGRVNTSGVLTGEETAPSTGNGFMSIVQGPTNLLWFTESTNNTLGLVTMSKFEDGTNSSISEVNLGSSLVPTYLAGDGKGNVWVVQTYKTSARVMGLVQLGG
jgi:streptogramin lyase